MSLKHDKWLDISTVNGRTHSTVQSQRLMWSELLKRLATPSRSPETLEAYLKMPKAKQDDLKDVGGYIAGQFRGNRRKAKYLISRSVVTLDLDNISEQGTDTILKRLSGLGCAYAVYSTRKHDVMHPRLRVLFPLARPVSADEYEPLARKLAQYVDAEMRICDPTTFEASRLMYWPSCCSDSDYVFTYSDSAFVDPDGLLKLYKNWRDVTEWPEVPGAPEARTKLAAKQGDPTTKPGVVGAFCRIYDVHQAITEFLADIYSQCEDDPSRYTYSKGSTTGGAVVYDDGAFLYSHHATDPAGGKLCNAFDLVRIHKFGAEDDDAKPGTPVNKLPSYIAMCNFAVADQQVTLVLNQDRYEQAASDFADIIADEDDDWLSKLTLGPNGTPEKTIRNILVVLENDSELKGKIAFDEFSNRGLVLGPLPWDARSERRDWCDNDDRGLRNYIESTQGITSRDKVDDAIGLCAFSHKINEVQDYLKSLRWDGVDRLDTLLIDYLGAANDAYVTAVTRKTFTAAVARAMTPGVKFDYAPILVGPQGIGKSTLLKMMAKSWFSDSLVSFEGKDAMELLQGVWINELGELSGFKKSEMTLIKNFISRTEDIFRVPFGRRTGRYPRRCIFIGTSNEDEFLRDPTGNRRFWPVTLMEIKPTKSVFNDLEAEVDQMWAEAVVRWQAGEPLHLTPELEERARAQQEAYRETSPLEGIVREFVGREIPLDWAKRDIRARQVYWATEFDKTDEPTTPRERVCAAEIWCEALKRDLGLMRRADAKEINGMLARLSGWARTSVPYKQGPYGSQRVFVQKTTLSKKVVSLEDYL